MRRPDASIARFLAPALAASLLVACGDGGGEPASVSFVQPQDGATIQGSNVQVALEAGGVEITSADIQEPGTAHHHVFVDRDVTPLSDTIPSGVPGILHYGRGQTEFEIQDLAPGEHRLIAVLAEWNHIPLDPPATDTVFITVEAEGDEMDDGDGDDMDGGDDGGADADN